MVSSSLHYFRWRLIESALACCACNAADILELAEERLQKGLVSPFDPTTLLIEIIPSLLENSDFPLLQGRCLVFASKFSNSFSPEVASRYGALSAQVIESQRADLSLKLSAVKAIRKSVPFLFRSLIWIPFSIYEGTNHDLLGQEAPRIVHVLVPLLNISNENTTCIVLETLRAVLTIQGGHWLDSSLSATLTSLLLNVWQKNFRGKYPTKFTYFCNAL